MNRSFWKWSAAVAVLAWTCGNAAPVGADDPPSIDLDEISRRLTQWRASFVNVRVVWELRSLPETDEPVGDEWSWPPDPAAGSLFDRDEWIWADHGLDLLEERSFFYEDGGSRIHSIEAFNGPKGVVFRAQFRRLTEGKPEEFSDLLLAGLGAGKPTSRKVRTPVKELYWPANAAWLPEMLSKWKWKLEEIEDVAGEPCARIVPVPGGDDGKAYFGVLWLDLNHDCLVRRHRRPEIAGQISGVDFIVDEFQRLEGGIWFPKRGRIQLGGTPHENHLFVVTEAAVNQSLDLSRFNPPAPAVGTVVDDHGRSYTHGVSTAQAVQEAKTNGAGEKKSGASSAVPPTSSWVWPSAALAAVSIVFLTIGFWFSHRNNEERS